MCPLYDFHRFPYVTPPRVALLLQDEHIVSIVQKKNVYTNFDPWITKNKELSSILYLLLSSLRVEYRP